MGIFKGKHAKVLTLMVSLTLIIVLTYIAVTDDKESKAKDAEVIEDCSEIEDVLAEDLDKNYPPTAREVVKYYCKIQKCMFNNKLKGNTLESLMDNEYALYDELFTKKRTYAELLEKRKVEIQQYNKNDKTIENYQVDTNEREKTWTNNNIKCSAVEVTFVMNEKKKKRNVKENFILRKNKKGQWKIVGMEPGELKVKKKENKKKVKKMEKIDILKKKK